MTGLSALPGASRVPSIARIVASQDGTVSGMPHLFGIAGTDTQMTDDRRGGNASLSCIRTRSRAGGLRRRNPHRHLPLQPMTMLYNFNEHEPNFSRVQEKFFERLVAGGSCEKEA